ncbi:hypothetical protein [Stappia sp.]|uniref:hypothetical protein n=1 Tax=Stappia sp. TaxID=1870903 RepID=UPI0032D968B0
MTKRLAVLCFAIAPMLLTGIGPMRAQDFDLPPMLDGENAPAASDTGIGPAPTADEDADVATVPDVGAAPPQIDDIPLPDIAVGEIPPIEDEADADTVAQQGEAESGEAGPPILPIGRTSSLHLETRGFRNEDRQGEDRFAGRFSAHWFGRGTVSDNLSILFNLRSRAGWRESRGFRAEDDINLDVQELAAAWDTGNNLLLEAGRINVRNGVALGFNPTDWFKADSLVTIDSQDPGDRREERLGTVVVSAATSLGSTLVQAGFRPDISAARDTVVTDADIVGLNLDRTNPSPAFYAKLSPNLGGNISLTGNVLVENGRLGGGAEVSGTLGNNLVLYGEAFIQHRLNLAAEALEDGTGSAAFRSRIGAADGYETAGQLAIGGTYSLPEAIAKTEDISLSLEYHYNGAGLTGRQLSALAGAAGADRAAAGRVRAFAARAQEPLARHQVFARFAWNDFLGDADFSAIAYYVPDDRSALAQIAASYPYNDNVEISLRAFSVFGSDTSVYGSNPLRNSIQLAVKYTF